MKGKLRKEFLERVETDLGIERAETDLDRDFIVGTVENLIHQLCDEIESRLLDVCDDLGRIEGLTEIDDIRYNLQKLMDDLW